MIAFILFILATIGMTNIIVHGKIMDLLGIRPWLKKMLSPEAFELFECYECSGFWSGLFCGAILISTNPFTILMCGFSGSLISQTYQELLYFIQSKTDFALNEDTNGDQK